MFCLMVLWHEACESFMHPDSEQAVVTEQWLVQGLETDGGKKGDF